MARYDRYDDEFLYSLDKDQLIDLIHSLKKPNSDVLSESEVDKLLSDIGEIKIDPVKKYFPDDYVENLKNSFDDFYKIIENYFILIFDDFKIDDIYAEEVSKENIIKSSVNPSSFSVFSSEGRDIIIEVDAISTNLLVDRLLNSKSNINGDNSRPNILEMNILQFVLRELFDLLNDFYKFEIPPEITGTSLNNDILNDYLDDEANILISILGSIGPDNFIIRIIYPFSVVAELFQIDITTKSGVKFKKISLENQSLLFKKQNVEVQKLILKSVISAKSVYFFSKLELFDKIKLLKAFYDKSDINKVFYGIIISFVDKYFGISKNILENDKIVEKLLKSIPNSEKIEILRIIDGECLKLKAAVEAATIVFNDIFLLDDSGLKVLISKSSVEELAGALSITTEENAKRTIAIASSIEKLSVWAKSQSPGYEALRTDMADVYRYQTVITDNLIKWYKNQKIIVPDNLKFKL